MRTQSSTTLFVAICISCLHTSYAAAKEEVRSVTASVTHGGAAAGIQAERVPGSFTVPEGHVATGLKYSFIDPSTNYRSTRLSGSNIYSETQRRYMSEVEGNPNAELPPGKYKFVVGGRPGSQGILSFKIVSATGDPPADRRSGNSLGLPRTFDMTLDPHDIYIVDSEGRKSLFYLEGVKRWGWPRQVVVRFRDGQVSAEWSGQRHSHWWRRTTTGKIAGTFLNGRFSGTYTVEWSDQVTFRDRGTLSSTYGAIWSLEGTVDSSGLLVLHRRWKSNFGESLHPQHGSADGYSKPITLPYESPPEIKAARTELHLRLPVGQDLSPRGITHSTAPVSQPVAAPPGATVAPGDTVWDVPGNDDPWQPPATPPVTQTEPPDPNNIWNTDDSPPIDEQAEDDKDIADNNRPKAGDPLPDGKILFKPPWDIGDPYPMDPEEVEEIKKKLAEGYRWSNSHGWVNNEDEKRINDIAGIQQRGADKDAKRTKDSFDELKKSKDREKEHADRAKRAGDLAVMQKAKALGWESLTADEKETLSKADDDIKDHLRGAPKVVRGYKRGIVDNTLSQGAIDATHTALEGVKWAADESIDFIGSKTGPAGKAIGAAYTMGTKILGTMSEENAKYNAGTSDKADYTKAATEGAKKGLTDVIVNELSGALNDKVTDNLLDSKAGKKAADYIEGQADKARKQLVRDFLGGKVDDLNASVLDKAGDAAAKAAKQNVTYAVGRASKPGYDATLKLPVSDAVNAAAGNQPPQQPPTTAKPDDQPFQLDELDEELKDE